jgi:hypothetical protein
MILCIWLEGIENVNFISQIILGQRDTITWKMQAEFDVSSEGPSLGFG